MDPVTNDAINQVRAGAPDGATDPLLLTARILAEAVEVAQNILTALSE